MRMYLIALLLGGACLTAVNPVYAQAVGEQKKEEIKKQDPVPPATGRNLSEQAGTTEPSSKVTTGGDDNVFSNGTLTVSGALPDTDTAPAKFSERTNADDQLPIAAYRLKRLSPDHRLDIARQIAGTSSQQKPSSDGYARVGAELPAAIALDALTPVPEALASKYPELRGTASMISDGKIVIVDRDNNLVVGVLTDS